MRQVDLAVYADALAGEAAAVAARAERLRSRLRQAAIERRARRELEAQTVERLGSLGLLTPFDERALRSELRELEQSLAALEELQAWVEGQLVAASAA
ncbi:MAG: hypothetical protein M3R70_02035 [Actinomycetota bacterium]|nr:hypothetical protein [Actinomycetota bacterium]